MLDPQTLTSNTSRADRVHTDDNQRNRKHYINYFVAAAKLGYSIGQITRFETAMNWFRFEREYLDIDTSIPIVGASPQETGGPASAKNPERSGKGNWRRSTRSPRKSRSEVFLEAEKEANPLYPLDTVKEEAKILYMMQPDIHAATVSGLNDVIDWSSSSDEEDQVISFDLPPGYQPKVSRPKGQAVEVAAVDPNDVGEDGQIKLTLTSNLRVFLHTPKSHTQKKLTIEWLYRGSTMLQRRRAPFSLAPAFLGTGFPFSTPRIP